jgi:hypothetical protein
MGKAVGATERLICQNLIACRKRYLQVEEDFNISHLFITIA